MQSLPVSLPICNTTSEQTYRQVRESREGLSNKAVLTWHKGVGKLPALLAGAN
jgi:hypothetical protein